jgi:hypothetical protein
MPVSLQEHPSASSSTTNHPDLLAIRGLGLDAVGTFPRSVGGYEYLLIAIDKFSKWVEVEPVRALTTHAAVKFIRGIVCRFSVPNRLITDLGSKFTSQEFQDYCNQMGTQICYASVAHPKSKGQVEHANVEVLQGLQTTTFNMLEGCGKNWVDQVPLYCGPYEPQPRDQPVRSCFHLSTGLKPCWPQSLNMDLLGYPPMTITSTQNNVLMMSTSLRRSIAGQ